MKTAVFAAIVLMLACGGCKKDHDARGERPSGQDENRPAVTNRVDIPAPVRRNLGVTFAKVEYRAVASTLRLPGRFELLPTARREYRATLGGRVELMVSQYQRVEKGELLAKLDAIGWRQIQEQLVSAESALAQASVRLESMGPLRAAHVRHEESLSTKIAMWQERVRRLEDLRAAGGGSGRELADARATLNSTEAELADAMEKDAELAARQRELQSEVRAAGARLDLLLRSAAAVTGMEPEELVKPAAGESGAPPVWRTLRQVEVRASAPGVVETLGVTNGGLAEEGGLLIAVVRPEAIRFRARALQSDLGRLREGLVAGIVPPAGATLAEGERMQGRVTLGLGADADQRTIDILVTPERIADWARAGVAAQLELTLDGGAEELAIPLAAVVRDGAKPVVFRRDPANADKAIRLEADLGVSDGRWIAVLSGVKEGDEVVVGGSYQLMLSMSGSMPKGGHFHADGTYHEGDH
ncbi:MAG: efflux RND transporter periplasmic adaptor subunit [Phycisphaerales bacterium]